MGTTYKQARETMGTTYKQNSKIEKGKKYETKMGKKCGSPTHLSIKS